MGFVVVGWWRSGDTLRAYRVSSVRVPSMNCKHSATKYEIALWATTGVPVTNGGQVTTYEDAFRRIKEATGCAAM